MSIPYLAKIIVYPIKSLDGVEVNQIEVLPSGALKCDRQLALFDRQDKFVNGKRYPQIHLLRSHFNLDEQTVSLQIPGNSSPQTFHLHNEQDGLAKTLGDFFGFPVDIKENPMMGFPDDTSSPGPTVISTGTLTEVAGWFPEMSVEEMRRRMRANLEIDGVPAFWEDRLFEETGNTVSFRIGDVTFLGVNPCQRCVVPTRNPETGETYKGFQRVFVSQRQKTLPGWVNQYRLSVNTRVSSVTSSGMLSVGDEVFA